MDENEAIKERKSEEFTQREIDKLDKIKEEELEEFTQEEIEAAEEAKKDLEDEDSDVENEEDAEEAKKDLEDEDSDVENEEDAEEAREEHAALLRQYTKEKEEESEEEEESETEEPRKKKRRTAKPKKIHIHTYNQLQSYIKKKFELDKLPICEISEKAAKRLCLIANTYNMSLNCIGDLTYLLLIYHQSPTSSKSIKLSTKKLNYIENQCRVRFFALIEFNFRVPRTPEPEEEPVILKEEPEIPEEEESFDEMETEAEEKVLKEGSTSEAVNNWLKEQSLEAKAADKELPSATVLTEKYFPNANKEPTEEQIIEEEMGIPEAEEALDKMPIDEIIDKEQEGIDLLHINPGDSIKVIQKPEEEPENLMEAQAAEGLKTDSLPIEVKKNLAFLPKIEEEPLKSQQEEAIAEEKASEIAQTGIIEPKKPGYKITVTKKPKGKKKLSPKKKESKEGRKK